jgi:hypothetical protein
MLNLLGGTSICLLCGANFVLTALEGEAGYAKDCNTMSLQLTITGDCDLTIASVVSLKNGQSY